MPNMNEKTRMINGRNPLSKNNRPPFHSEQQTEAALWLKDNEISVEKSGAENYTGEVITKGIVDFKLESDKPCLNAIVLEGGTTTLLNPEISMSGTGCSDFTCKGAGVLATGGAKVDIRGGEIVTHGATRTATTATAGASLKVFNAKLASYGGPLPEDYVPVIGPGMMEPPYPLGLGGNCRTHLSLDNSETYFYNCEIYADAWAALSTDSSGGYVYLEANDCDVRVENNGYICYADKGSHVTLNRCDLYTGNVIGILDGNSTFTFRDTTGEAKGYGFLLHGGMHDLDDIGQVYLDSCEITSEEEIFRCKSSNLDVYVKDSVLTSKDGVIVKTMLTDDEHYYRMRCHGEDEYGSQFTFENMDLFGDMLCLDPERKNCINLVASSLTGGIEGNPTLQLAEGSTFLATKDSELTLVGLAEGLDAAAGITITLHCGRNEEVTLPSGGKLKMV